VIEFWVAGVPAQQGSKIPGRRKDGRLFVRDAADKTLKPWRAAVVEAAKTALGGRMLTGPVGLSIEFVFPAPASEPLRIWKHTAPDLSKLIRAVEDALTDAKVWEDDARVVEYGPMYKVCCLPQSEPGALVRVWEVRQGTSLLSRDRLTLNERKAA